MGSDSASVPTMRAEFLISPTKGEQIRADISEKVKEFRNKVRARSSREPKGATGPYGE